MPMDITLDQIEVRVLGSLLEKELATPEYYPLSLNGLTNACNQKTNRYPVVSLDEDTVMAALHSLKKKRLVGQSDASRVPKYWHDFTKQHNLIRREAALLCLLLLRGPQTTGELRSRTERLCSFASLEEVQKYLENLAEIGFVAKVPRQPGQKEQRFRHLLSGETEQVEPMVVSHGMEGGAAATDRERISELENTVASLKEEIEQLKDQFLSFRNEFK